MMIYDILIPLAFLMVIYFIVDYHKKRKAKDSNKLEYENSVPADTEPRFQKISERIKSEFAKHSEMELLNSFNNMKFYLVSGITYNGIRIYGRAVPQHNRAFLDRATIVSGTEVDAFGLILHEFAHEWFDHFVGGVDAEAQANEFTKKWLKLILDEDF